MLTPGIAGSIVMVIANTLWLEFMIPQKWTALILSFLLIIPILIRFSASYVENAIYFTFNGLIVFALAVNSNFAGRKLQEIAASDNKTIAIQQLPQVFNTMLASTISTNQDLQIKKMNGIQLASNSDQSILIRVSENNQQDSTQKENKKSEGKDKKKRSKDKDDREFFESWF